MPQNVLRPDSALFDNYMANTTVFDPLAPKQLNLLDIHDKQLKLEALITGELDSEYEVKWSTGHYIFNLYNWMSPKWSYSQSPKPLTIQLKLPLNIKPTFKESMQAHKKFYLNKMKRIFRG